MASSQRVGTLAVFAAVLALGGCATMGVSWFQARGVDFKQFRTYAWAVGDELETGDPRLDNNPFFLERLRGAVDRELAAKGYEKTDGDATLTIHYHASVTQRLDLTNIDPKYTSVCEGCEPFAYDEGSLVLDFVDPRTNVVVWRGWAEGSIDGVLDSQDRMEEVVDRAVARILEQFPGGL